MRSFVLVLGVLIGAASVAGSQTLLSDMPVTGGRGAGAGGVTSLLKDGNTLYLGGMFTSIGPSTGRGVLLDTVGGKFNPAFPKVNGPVYVCVSDSQGGWYIGGEFTMVGTTPRNSLAHIVADGSVDRWDPSPTYIDSYGGKAAGWVQTIALMGSTVYIGGIFDHVGDSARVCVASIERGVATVWNPDPDGLVFAIAPTPSSIYIAGKFSTLLTSTLKIPRSSLAAVDPRTGAPQLWAPSINGGNLNPMSYVYGLLLSDTTLFVWGNIFGVDGFVRYGVAALRTNVLSNYVTSWNPQTYKNVSATPYIIEALALKGDTVFMGGTFTRFGSVARTNIVAVSRSTGQVFPWNPSLKIQTTSARIPNEVKGLAVSGNTLFVAGAFDTVSSVMRHNLAAFDMTSGTLTNWDPYVSSTASCLAAYGGSVYAGGYFTSANDSTRLGIAAIDLPSKKILPWNPNLGGAGGVVSNIGVNALAVSDSVVYLGGYFSTVNGLPHAGLGGVDKRTGTQTIPLPSVSYSVIDLALSNNKLYLAGTLATVGDSARAGLACVDLTNSSVTAWNPNSNPAYSSSANTVNSIAIVDSTLYAGGSFGALGDSIRQCLGAVNINTGAVSGWNPTIGPGHIDAKLRKVVVAGNSVYVGGGFTTFADNSIPYIAKIDRHSGAIANWNPQLGSHQSGMDGIPGVFDIAVVDTTHLYMCGPLSAAGGQKRWGIAATGTVSAAVTSWDPEPNSEVNAVLVDPKTKTVFFGGGFDNVHGESQSYFAAYTDTTLVSSTTGVVASQELPGRFTLSQNYPNPFNPSTTFTYTIADRGRVVLKMYNILGQLVQTLLDRDQNAGTYRVVFDASHLPSGVYYCRLESSGQVQTRKALLLK